MRTKKWAVLATVITAGVAGALLFARRDQVQPQKEPPVDQHVVDTASLLVGTPSCSARGCHGGIEPVAGQRLLRDEYTSWVRTDKHAAAYRVLFGDRARRIMKNLSATAEPALAQEDSRCLACHSLPG